MSSARRLKSTTSTFARADKGPAEAYRVYHLFGQPVLAVPERPRWLRLIGWRRYHPFTLKRTAVQRFMQFATLLHLDRVFCKLAKSPFGYEDLFEFRGWLEQVREEIISPTAHPVIIWPPQKDRGRVYVHLLNTSGLPVGFAKVSFDDRNDELLHTESKVLRTLHSRRLQTCYVPDVLFEGLWQGHRYVVEEPLPTDARPVPDTPSTYPQAFVEELRGHTRIAKQEEVELFTWWRGFNETAEGSFQFFLDELRSIIAMESGLPVCRVHGDLGSANLARANGRFWVLDWEDSTEDGPVLSDQIGYDLAVHAKALRRRPKKELRRFSDQYLNDASPPNRRDIMAALAFLQAIGRSNADLYIQNWFTMTAPLGL